MEKSSLVGEKVNHSNKIVVEEQKKWNGWVEINLTLV